MCGIVGYLGNKSAKDVVIKGLKRLEYRGYDSSGIATMESNKLVITKTSGKVADLISSIPSDRHLGSMGIGHTRWATHGEPAQRNAHPHISGKIAVVHNGIIENFQILDFRNFGFFDENFENQNFEKYFQNIFSPR